jgi:hypothetical protein
MPWWLIPLYAELLNRNYTGWARGVITHAIEQGRTTSDCVADGWLEADDLPAADVALAAGRAGGWLRDAVDDKAPAIAVAKEVANG